MIIFNIVIGYAIRASKVLRNAKRTPEVSFAFWLVTVLDDIALYYYKGCLTYEEIPKAFLILLTDL